MKAMLSQPMAGKTDEEIVETREKAIKALKEKGYEIVNTLSRAKKEIPVHRDRRAFKDRSRH